MKKNKTGYIILTVIITLILMTISFFYYYKFYLQKLVIEKTIKEVVIDDKGISEAVNKVYDSTVVVENYINGRLYSTGTGVVFKKDNNYGYILTNNHVIENGTEIKVIFTNDEIVLTKVIGSDTYSDIAVLAVDKNKIISIAEIGDSDQINVGDTAFTIGAPIDASTYSWTVTRGIISGKNREVEITPTIYTIDSYLMEVIQTDAAINEGNSGGPLCNSNGEVIGITNMKLSSTTVEGMGFAIPIKTAITNAEKIISGKKISRPYLGISIYETPDNKLIIKSVETNSPAEKANLKEGDIIKKINDEEIKDISHFKYQLYKYDIGHTITITVERNNKEISLEVNLTSEI